MKKISIFIMVMLSLSMFQSKVFASEKNINSDAITRNEIPEEVKIMLNRLEEIKIMDKSSMNRLEKKNFVKKLARLKQI
jgi:hypothetical protein